MPEITEVDFGKDARDSRRAFARLLRFCDDMEMELVEDPRRLYKEAGDWIVALTKVISDAQEALMYPVPDVWAQDNDVFPLETVTITKVDYDRWRACEAILRKFNPYA